jgi:hypothetical protein
VRILDCRSLLGRAVTVLCVAVRRDAHGTKIMPSGVNRSHESVVPLLELDRFGPTRRLLAVVDCENVGERGREGERVS